MAREYLRITTESTWGTYDAGGSATIVQLTDSNSFTMRPNPVRWTIRSAGGYNRRWQSGSSKTIVSGALNNLVVYGSQISAWLAWIQPTGSAPGPYDLPSCTIDHSIEMEDGSNTNVFRRYLGVKVGGWQLTSSADSQLLRLSFTSLVGKSAAAITSSDFAEPAATSYPSGTPFVHEHASAMTLSSSRTEFDSFQVTGTNLLDPRFFNGTTISYLKYCGRDIDWSIMFPYIISTDRTSLYEGTTASSMSITYTIPASNTLTMNFESQNIIGGVADALDYNRLFTQTISGWSQVDTSVASDFVATST